MANVSIPDDFPTIWRFACHGIRLFTGSTAPDTVATDPSNLMTNDHCACIKADTPAVLAEIVRFDTEEIEFMWASKNFESWTDTDPRYGRDTGGGVAPIYRLVEPEYYTWLRARMENAKAANMRGDMPAAKYDLAREAFNVIFRYVTSHFSVKLLGAAKTVAKAPKYYYPIPNESSILAQKREWASLIAANEDRARMKAMPPHEPNRYRDAFAGKLDKQGYAQIHVDWTDVPIVIMSDGMSLDSLPRGLRYACSAFTLQEVTLLRNKPVADVKSICEVKAEFHDSRVIREMEW